MDRVLSSTLFLAKQLDDFEGFRIPGDDYEVIACRASESLIAKYPDVLVYELVTGERTYSTQSIFKKIFNDFGSYSRNKNFKYLWTYQAYPWTDDLKTAGIKVFCIDYLMFLKLQNKLSQRRLFLLKAAGSRGIHHDLYERLNYSNQVLKTQIISRHLTSYEKLFKKYNTDFVICDSYSDGGEGIYRIRSKNDFLNALTQIKSPVIRTELFLPNAIPVNQIASVSSEGHVIKYKPSIQIIQNIHHHNKMEYAGCDFNSELHLHGNNETLKTISKITHQIGKILFKIGYRGIFGCDYVVMGEDVHFMEINPRYQASTFVLTRCIGNNPILAPHIQHILGFIQLDQKQAKIMHEFDVDNRFVELPETPCAKGYIKIFGRHHKNMFKPRSDIQIEDGLEKGYVLFDKSILTSTSFPASVSFYSEDSF